MHKNNLSPPLYFFSFLSIRIPPPIPLQLHYILFLVSNGILCHYGNLHRYCHGWLKLNETMPIIETKFGNSLSYFLYEILKWIVDIWMKNNPVNTKWHKLQYCNSIMSNLCFYKEQPKMIGLHLVLVTLHDQFTMSIEQDNQN